MEFNQHDAYRIIAEFFKGNCLRAIQHAQRLGYSSLSAVFDWPSAIQFLLLQYELDHHIAEA